MATVTKGKSVEVQPSPEVVAAWMEYFHDTKSLSGFKYDEVEPHAWSMLKARLSRCKGKAIEAVTT